MEKPHHALGLQFLKPKSMGPSQVTAEAAHPRRVGQAPTLYQAAKCKPTDSALDSDSPRQELSNGIIFSDFRWIGDGFMADCVTAR